MIFIACFAASLNCWVFSLQIYAYSVSWKTYLRIMVIFHVMFCSVPYFVFLKKVFDGKNIRWHISILIPGPINTKYDIMVVTGNSMIREKIGSTYIVTTQWAKIRKKCYISKAKKYSTFFEFFSIWKILDFVLLIFQPLSYKQFFWQHVHFFASFTPLCICLRSSTLVQTNIEKSYPIYVIWVTRRWFFLYMNYIYNIYK